MSLYIEISTLVISRTRSRRRLLKLNSQSRLWLLWNDPLSYSNLIIHTPCLTIIIIFISQSELVQNIESLVKHNFHTLSKIHALNYKLLTWNIWKHHQSGYKGNHEWKKMIDHVVQCLDFQKIKKNKNKNKEKEKWYQIKGESSCVVCKSTRSC